MSVDNCNNMIVDMSRLQFLLEGKLQLLHFHCTLEEFALMTLPDLEINVLATIYQWLIFFFIFSVLGPHLQPMVVHELGVI